MFRLASRRQTIALQLGLSLLAVLYALPLVILLRVSLQGEGLGNYAAVLRHPMIPRFFLNSAIVTTGTIALVYAVTVLAAYAFSKLEFKGKELLFNAIFIGLLLPGVAILVPLFLTVKRLGLFDNYLALILPYAALTTPFTLLLMRNFFDGLPNELLDASRIDGCNSFTTLLHVVLPLSKPISVVVIVFTFLGAWNEFFLALVFMRSESMQMITQAPQFFVGVWTQDTGKIFASLVLISVPIIVTYLSLQKYFEGGLTAGSLK